MATLVLTAVGTVLGGPIGGAIGALAGRQIDKAIFSGGTRSGPRLQDLKVQSSSYGDPLPLHFGTIRTAGTVIWSSELVEHENTSGGGKGQPKVKTYDYTASFAVAIAGRPIRSVGRIWADGNLLRGAAGDLKVGGEVRIHTGHGDQAPDPLMVQAEASGRCPAHRGVALVVFEDLQLASFGNRIPSLSFEVEADERCDVAAILSEIVPGASCASAGDAFEGFTIDRGSAGDTISAISSALPLATWVKDGSLVIAPADSSILPVATLPEPSANEDDRGRGAANGWSKRREPLPRISNCAVRYYDRARDFQPGFQRGKGRSEPGELQTVDLPATMSAAGARAIADRTTLRLAHAVERISYRTAEIDPSLLAAPLVRLPVAKGLWRIEDWEWQKDGVSLGLVSVPASSVPAASTFGGGDPGRFNSPDDLTVTATVLAAFELPWDGVSPDGEAPLCIAASSSGAGWKGAALFGRAGDGPSGLTDIGAAPPRRAVLGTTLGPIGAASPMLFDCITTIEIELAADDLVLGDADMVQLANGRNLALVGSELLQFARAVPLGGRRWQLSTLLRGRAGTEWAIATHGAPEAFVLLDSKVIRVPDTHAENFTEVVAVGLGDAVPVHAAICGQGSALRPLSPVHGKGEMLPDGSLRLTWTRRARGAWRWNDEVDTPLHEESEAWDIVAGEIDAPLGRFATGVPSLLVPVSTLASLGPAPHRFQVRQVGRTSMSKPLTIAIP